MKDTDAIVRSVRILGIILAIAFAVSACGAVARASTSEAVAPTAAPEYASQEASLSSAALPPSAQVGKVGTAPSTERAQVQPAPTSTANNGSTQDVNARGSEAASKPRPLLVYEATLTLAVYEVGKALDRVEELAKQAGGYLVNRNGSSIVVRVPAADFDGSLTSLLALGDVLQRDVRVEDVTAKVRDMEARLKNAEAVRIRLTELLARAAKTEEALAVERELARVTDEIERMKGQLKLWSELIAFSTITIRFTAPQQENLDRRFKLPFPWLEQLGLSNLLAL